MRMCIHSIESNGSGEMAPPSGMFSGWPSCALAVVESVSKSVAYATVCRPAEAEDRENLIML